MSYNAVILVLGTLISGAANSLFTKYQDGQCVLHCDNPDQSKHVNFEQPALQTMQMFVGEFAMIIIFYLIYRTDLFSRKTDYLPIDNQQGEDEERRFSLFDNVKLAVPAICDLLCTTLLNIGLVYTPVSIYQMTRGSLVLFVAILLVIFLKRRVTKLEWISLSLVTFGVGLVGLSGSSNSGHAEKEESSQLVIFGIGLIVFAEFLQSFQFVVEEQILAHKSIIPIKLVYCEGFYGLTTLVLVTVVLNFVIGYALTPEEFLKSPFNIHESLRQMFYLTSIWGSSICIMVSIAAFNFFGISITNELSATSRSTVDTCRTLLVWAFAIIAGWEEFHLLQFTGFALLVFGTLCFNKVIEPEHWAWVPAMLKD